MPLKELLSDLNKLKNPERAKDYARFFKTGKGQYGEGDKFLGILVPEQRKIVKKYYKDITLPEVGALLKSEFHEHRLTGLIILVEKYKRTDEENADFASAKSSILDFAPKRNRDKKKIYEFYVKNLSRINNWDLVDVTCRDVVGAYLYDKDRKFLYDLAKSKNLWHRRVAIISTLYFIGKNDFKDTLKIAAVLLKDKHDLIHKAVGWALREVGKKDLRAEEEFLEKYCKTMPRTMLRYAIEKFSKRKRQYYLKLKV